MRADIDGKPEISAQWVSRQTDGIVALSVKSALTSVYAALPSDMRSVPDDGTFHVVQKRKVRITLSGRMLSPQDR
ncbi:hypothetical protein B2G74_13670 [Burkholderia sp. A27]|nr:hypothetical protein B2G74_13670 [Burkholderia sp. A27]